MSASMLLMLLSAMLLNFTERHDARVRVRVEEMREAATLYILR